ncbi:MAG TPA: SMC-Scp complex subunit ScpB, partial [Stellaceae bacterium]|nr:SMC-Scp complex subunit ScpB [Stellaceae bacterium]
LSHFGLADRSDLPGIDELKAAGLIGPRPDFTLAETVAPLERPEEDDASEDAEVVAEAEGKDDGG